MTFFSEFSSDMTCGIEERALPRGGRLLRLPEVMDRVGLRRSAIYERMKCGSFPQSRKLGPRYTVWVESEIEEWVRAIVKQ